MYLILQVDGYLLLFFSMFSYDDDGNNYLVNVHFVWGFLMKMDKVLISINFVFPKLGNVSYHPTPWCWIQKSDFA